MDENRNRKKDMLANAQVETLSEEKENDYNNDDDNDEQAKEKTGKRNRKQTATIAESYQGRLKKNPKANIKRNLLSAYQIFKKFIIQKKHPETGDMYLDASGVCSKSCYDTWLNSRYYIPENPELAFQRALCCHVSGTGGREPFSSEEEDAIIKVLRSQEFWPCFEHSNIESRNLGSRTAGFHERQTSAEEEIRSKKRKRASPQQVLNNKSPEVEINSTTTTTSTTTTVAALENTNNVEKDLVLEKKPALAREPSPPAFTNNNNNTTATTVAPPPLMMLMMKNNNKSFIPNASLPTMMRSTPHYYPAPQFNHPFLTVPTSYFVPPQNVELSSHVNQYPSTMVPTYPSFHPPYQHHHPTPSYPRTQSSNLQAYIYSLQQNQPRPNNGFQQF